MQDRSLGDEFQNLYRRIQTLEELIEAVRSQLATTHSGNRLVANTIIGIVPPTGGGTGFTTGSGPTIQPFINNTGGNLEDGDVVVLDPTGTRLINTTTTPGDILAIGVVRDLNAAGPFADQAETPVMLLGNNALVKVDGAVAAGDYLQASGSAGEAESAGATPTDGSFAIAETAFAGPGSGTVAAFIFGIDNIGGAGALPTGGSTGQALAKDSGADGDATWHDIEDLATGETDTTLVLRPDGAGGVVFDAESAAPATFRGARVYKSTDFSHNSSGNYLPITFDTERYDTDAFHDTGSNTTRFTIPAGLDGYYHIGGAIIWDSNATGNRDLGIFINGTVQIATYGNLPGASQAQVVSADYFLNAGDYAELRAFQGSGGTRAISAVPATSPEFWIHLIGT